MANIHTNYLTGDDATGDGSTLLPYKTIAKALEVAVDGDVVKVAGGELVQIPGATVTTTAKGTSISTSIDLTGDFVAGDSIFIATTDGFPLVANGIPVSTINSTTITVGTDVTTHMAPGTYDVYKLSEYHYISTSNITFETFAAPTADNVLVEGGWDSTFTTQIGWTGVKHQASTAQSTFTSTWSFVKPGIVFNRFLFSNLFNAFNSSNCAIGINEIAFLRISINTFGSSNFGVWEPSSVGFTTIYSYGSDLQVTWNGSANRPATLNLKQWHTATTNSGNKNSLKTGFSALDAPSIRSLEAHWRSLGSQANESIWAVIQTETNGNMTDIFIDELNLYIGGSSIHPIFSVYGQNSGAYKYVGDINVINIDGTKSGIYPFVGIIDISANAGSGVGFPINVNRTSGLLEDLPWLQYGSASLTDMVARCGQSPLFGKDSEGQKVINCDVIPKFADPVEYVTGSNSLRFKLITNSGGSDNFYYFCGNINKPTATTPFTITVKVKGSKNFSIGGIGLAWGNYYLDSALFTPSTTTITTSWQDLTFTVDPSVLDRWNFTTSGLMQVGIRVGSTVLADQDELAYMWVDSVTIS